MAQVRDFARDSRDSEESLRKRKILNITLWIIQVLVALLFLFAGVVKLVIPLDQLNQGPVVFPGLFLRFIGVVEVLGGLGLILPGLLKIRPGLTSLAAVGLIIIMIGAVVVTVMSGPLVTAITPLVVGTLCAFVAYGRWQLAPHRERSASRTAVRA